MSPSHNVASSSKFAGMHTHFNSNRVKLHTFINLCTSGTERKKKESVPHTMVSQLSGNQSACAADVSSSHQVSQSIPQSDLSPVLAKYKKYLQSCYNARVLAPADKYLPTLESPYINLAMIRRGRYNSAQSDEFTIRTLHGGVDQILKNKTSMNIEDLLTPEDQITTENIDMIGMISGFTHSEYSDLLKYYHKSQTAQCSKMPVRFILVEGPPGIGKSTFAWEVCRRWDEIESLRDYHTVVLLRLREKWVLNATSLSDLLRYPSHPDFSNSIAEELVESQGEKLLFVLDGFDEVSQNFDENSVIKSILCRQLLPECTIILTTRPVAKTTLESICQPQVDKHVEIIGFTEQERVKYITEVFSKEPELQVNFFRYMFLVPHIKSMMYIPLNCAIIAQVYYESQSSHHLAIPRTRTQLYKALTHSLLVRHMKMKESNREYLSMLPEGLDEENMERFKVLTKFAFDTYHKGESRKVTFFKEDIPEGLVHFGFMNESTEMYAGKGVEKTFSFLHLSLQEYLAACHLADSYSVEFQVAYHRLAVKPYGSVICKGDEKERALISSLQQQRSSLVEPAIFLAGNTGWRCQSENDMSHWERYLSHNTEGKENAIVLLQSLYEAQNPTLCPHYFGDTADDRDPSVLLLSRNNPTHSPHFDYAAGKNAGRRRISIGSFNSLPTTSIAIRTPYDCYALSYCLAHSSDEFSLSIGISRDDEIALVETFVKGLRDHCKSNTPIVTKLKIHQNTESAQNSNNCLFWLTQANCLTELKEMEFGSQSSELSSHLVHNFFHKLVNVQYVFIHIPSWEWLPLLKSLDGHELKGFHINKIFDIPQYEPYVKLATERAELERLTRRTLATNSQIYCSWQEAILNIEIPSSTLRYITCHSINAGIDSLLKSVLKSNEITKMVLFNISRETMAGVNNILVHCPSLTTLMMKRTRLGYDGVLYICSALRNNTKLRRLVIYDDFQLPPLREERYFGDIKFISFSSMKRVPLPSKTTCTDLLLELNNILKDNTTLEEMKIQSGLFLPLSAGEDGGYCQWTGLGPLQQFNVGAVGSGMSPNLRRSFSSSDLTQPQTTLFWDRWFAMRGPKLDVNFEMVFSKNKLFHNRQERMSLLSFTAPDTEVLQSFSGLDPRLKKYLGISHLQQHLQRLGETYWGMLGEVHNMQRTPRRFF